jgi:acetolactate synthase-1/2/3 large subunit
MNQATMNFPGDHDMHLGYDSHCRIKDADVILVIDSDVPWVTAISKPSDGCRVFYLDTDPLKKDIPIWYIPSERFIQADSYTALRQLNAVVESKKDDINEKAVEARRNRVRELHRSMKKEWRADEADESKLTPVFIVKCVRETFGDDAVVLNEAITSAPAIDCHLPRSKPGTYFYSGGSSLGWNGGAAVGMKLACPDKEIVALTGDGSYVFSCPTAVYWMARRYNTPFMTVIFNNQGWNAPKTITKNEHPDGYAAQGNTFWTSFNPPAQLDMIAAAAGGAFARTVTEPADLRAALREGRQAVKDGRCAVINVMMSPV